LDKVLRMVRHWKLLSGRVRNTKFWIKYGILSTVEKWIGMGHTVMKLNSQKVENGNHLFILTMHKALCQATKFIHLRNTGGSPKLYSRG
jgi:hypothetical protein